MRRLHHREVPAGKLPGADRNSKAWANSQRLRGSISSAVAASRVNGLNQLFALPAMRIPGEVARDSGMISPAIPI